MKKLSLLLALMVIGASRAGADDDQAKSAPDCRQQIASACPGLKPGDGKFAACLKDHKDDIDQDCRDKIREKVKSRMAERGGACKAEAEKACPGLKPGDGKFGPCIKEHKSELSLRCRFRLARMMRRAKKKADDGGDDDGGQSVSPSDGKKTTDAAPGDGGKSGGDDGGDSGDDGSDN